MPQTETIQILVWDRSNVYTSDSQTSFPMFPGSCNPFWELLVYADAYKQKFLALAPLCDQKHDFFFFSLMLMTLYNISINKEGHKLVSSFPHVIEGLLSTAENCQNNESILIIIQILETLADVQANPSFSKYLVEVVCSWILYS